MAERLAVFPLPCSKTQCLRAVDFWHGATPGLMSILRVQVRHRHIEGGALERLPHGEEQ